jgi:PKD repeat protein
MEKKKILICLIACMFVASMLPGVVGEQNADMYTFQELRFIEQKDLKGVYNQHGIEKFPGSRGKPAIEVEIISPGDGSTVDGNVAITVSATKTPTITIDGTVVATGYAYQWDTTSYSDGTHVIRATRQTVYDEITVTVDNGGVPTNNPPDASFTYSATDLTVDFTDTSTDSDGYIASWSWDFGDDDTSTEENPTHIYAIAGTYDVTLIVNDDDVDSDTITQPVTVSIGGGDVNKYALVIGISDYNGTSSDLQYCDDDAQDWKNFFQGEQYTVTTLIDQQATAQEIVDALYDLATIADGDDYIAFAYSGHGATLSTGSCIVSIFDGEDCQHIFFSFDACVIGDFQGLITNNRVGAFASNNRNSYDGDSSMQNGVFTYYQMEGWDIHDTFEEDAAYAVQEMKDWPPSRRIKVDPFYVDQFAGMMYP